MNWTFVRRLSLVLGILFIVYMFIFHIFILTDVIECVVITGGAIAAVYYIARFLRALWRSTVLFYKWLFVEPWKE